MLLILGIPTQADYLCMYVSTGCPAWMHYSRRERDSHAACTEKDHGRYAMYICDGRSMGFRCIGNFSTVALHLHSTPLYTTVVGRYFTLKPDTYCMTRKLDR